MFRKNVAGQFIHVQGVDSSTGGIKSGVTWTVRRCIDGTFAAATGTATEDGTTGWYKFALSQADTNGNNIAFNFTGTGAVPQTVNIVTTACDPTSTAFGLSIAKTTNITGFNDIAATAVVSGGAITTSSGAVSTVTTTTTATNLTNLPSIPANWITAAGITAAALNGKGDWNVGKTGYTLTAGTGLGNQTANITGSLSGSVGSVTGLTVANLDVAVSTRLATAGYTAPLDAAGTRTAVGLASANLDTQLSTIDTVVDAILVDTGTDIPASLTTIDDFLDTEVAAIKAVTDKLDTALELDGAVYRYTTNALEQAPTGGSAPTAAAIADAVWLETLADHSGTAGSTAAALSAAGGSGDPWSTALPGAYGAGTAGKIIGDNINATISSRATQTSVDDIPTNAELTTALGTADDATLAQIALVKAKTDLIPAAPAAVGDIPTATQNADALLNRDMASVSDTNARSPLNALRFLRNKFDTTGGTLTVKKENDTTTAWTAVLTSDPAAEPVTGSDPA
jgi:hypothetical protein